MMKKLIGISALLVLLAGVPVYADAADTGSAADQAAQLQQAEAGKRGHERPNATKQWLNNEKLLNLLQLDREALEQQLKNGKTLAQIAEAQGVARADLKAILITVHQDALDQAKAKFAVNVDKLIDSKLQMKMHGAHKRGSRIDFTDVAKQLGMSEAELHASLAKGTSLADLAKQKGVDAQQLTSLIATQLQAKADDALKQGRITQEQYDQRKAKIQEMAGQIVNGSLHSNMQHTGH